MAALQKDVHASLFQVKTLRTFQEMLRGNQMEEEDENILSGA